jgi:hypothetical protein
LIERAREKDIPCKGEREIEKEVRIKREEKREIKWKDRKNKR